MVNSGEKQKHCFRILIIGRANAGKTTLLRHISGADSSEEPVYKKIRRKLWVKPTKGINPTDERGVHDINQPFHFPSNSRFIFHDSPGFETGDETQLKQVQDFIYERSEENEQLHAIWFCLLTNASRPLLELETKFFNEERPGKVPVIAIFTKFDDLITQVYDPELGPQENRQAAEEVLDIKFRKPLSNLKFPPIAYLTMEDMHKNSSLCQNQIKILTEETANSLDGLALKLFVSTQRNNLELCLRKSVLFYDFDSCLTDRGFIAILGWFPHIPLEFYDLEYLLRSSRRMPRIKANIMLRIYSLNNAHPLGEWIEFKKSFRKEFWGNSKNQNLNVIGRIALILCAENSFWRCALGVPYVQALGQSFQEYKVSESRRVIEAAIQVIAMKHSRSLLDGKKGRSKIKELLLNNRLPRPVGFDDEQQ